MTSACTVGGDDGVADDGDDQPPAPVLASIAGGRFLPIAPYTGIDGTAIVARHLDGTTEVSLSIAGVAPSQGFAAHVHAQPCAYQGGGHYKIDPTVLDTVEANELWLVPQSSASGVASAHVTFPHLARGEALSVVVHDAANGNAKMACADLAFDEAAATIALAGTFAPLAPADPLDAAIAGSATATRSAVDTQFTLALTGLDPAQSYTSHLHAEPCAVDKGGGHYKLDPSVTTTDELNEIWFVIGQTTPGTATATLTRNHPVRSDAQAIVVHRIAGETAVKVACADLPRTTAFAPLATTGAPIVLPDAGGAVIGGSATLTRTLAATTEVALTASGLTAGATYKAHVHAQPCGVEAGGGHYMIDPAGTPGAADNELQLELVAAGDGTGSARVTAPHLARADAQAVVLHAADGKRLACFDLH